MQGDEKRLAIIQAAFELVGEFGFHGAPMAMVAQRAGVATGTIYRYFESKDILITEIYADLEKRLLAAVVEKYPEGRPVRDRFIHMAKIIVHYSISSPLEFQFLEQFHNSPYGAAHRRDKIFGKTDQDICTELFDEARNKQIMKDLPLPILFALAFGPLLNICRDHILGFQTLDDDLIGRTVEACWDAVKR
jgi:AcrR family transcriptional regulator